MEIVLVTHNFDAKQNDEISIRAGETIQVIEKDDAFLDGWWRGRNARGQVGLFPVNYTVPQQSSPSSALSPADMSLEAQIGSLQNALSSLELGRCRCSTVISPSMATAAIQQQQQPMAGSSIRQKLDACLLHPSLHHQHASKWTVDQVTLWLEAMGFGDIALGFKEEEITGDVLLEMTPDLLKELGISTFGKRFRLHSAIKMLRDRMPPIEETVLETEHNNTRGGEIGNKNMVNHTLKEGSTIPDTCQRTHSHVDPLDAGSGTPLSPLRSMVHQVTPEQPSMAAHPNNDYHMTTTTMTPPISEAMMMANSMSIGDRERSKDDKRKLPAGDEFVVHNGLLAPAAAAAAQQDHHHHQPPSASSIQPQLSSTPTLPPPPAPTLPVKSSRLRSLALWNSANVTIAKRNALAGDEHSKPEIEGWLYKRSDKYRTWNKRWFILKGSTLFYLKSPKDLAMKGLLNLVGYRISVDETLYPGKYCFKAQRDGERSFYFYTESESSMREWLHALIKATIVRDYNQAVASSSRMATVPLDVAQRMNPRPPSIIMRPNNMKRTRPHLYTVSRPSPQHNNNLSSAIIDPSSSRVHPQGMEQVQNMSGVNKDLSSSSSSHQQPRLRLNNAVSDNTADQQQQQQPVAVVLEQENDYSDYLQWVNQHLSHPIQSIQDIRTGEPFAQLLESICKKPLHRPDTSKPKSASMQMLDIIVASFAYMGREGIRIKGKFTIKDIFSGDQERILLMLDTIRQWETKQNNKHQQHVHHPTTRRR
ncbi:hypothetical protein O0I10_000949 [Lichtheimia ornata]|uniref:Uncharacterized protein n=1 Tax=Lichtheimia ornata TaxID=688661 RepID=A0AAD7Y4M7_9FUNG|nr:uncharacterized protein O0I10_000949 [Lichtheimia ornata]KAJ8663700.1 hypothetical protein O0I10_000949 [Lichtheimia ornata]